MAAAGLLAGPLLSGCSSSGASSDRPATPSGSGTAKHLTIGVVVNNLSDSNQADILRGYQDQGAKYGWTIKSTDSQGDPAKANAAMSTYVQQHVDGIAVLVYQGSVLQAGITAAKTAKIPVVLNGANDLVDGVAGAIPVAAGKAEAEALIKAVGTEASVLMFTYPPGAPCVAQFDDSKKVFDANPGIKYTTHDVPAPGWVVEAQKATATWLQTHPVGSGKLAIWGCWDGPTFGAIAALTAANRTDVQVFGNGGEPDALTAIKSGKMAASIFFDQYAGGGVAGATMMHDAIAAGSSWTPTVQLNPSELVDANNIADLCAKYASKCK